MRHRIKHKPAFTTTPMKLYFRTIVRFTHEGHEIKKSFSGELSEAAALERVQRMYPNVKQLNFIFHDEL